jgi:hypothetical protein
MRWRDVDPLFCRSIRALRIYLTAVAVANLIWEALQLPLYTIWQTGTLQTQAFAIVHCTIGDVIIASCVLTIALVLTGDGEWPQKRFRRVAILAILLGLAYTVFSEWLNVVVRASWAYSDLMPVMTAFGLRVGLSPLLQWLVIPTAAFMIAKRSSKRIQP